MSIGIRRIDHVQITAPAEHLEATVGFYRDVFALEPVGRPRRATPRPGAWFRMGEVKVHVALDAAARFDENLRSKRHVCFIVASLREAEAALRAAGVTILPDEDPIPGWPRFFLRDPAGNRVEMAQPAIG